MIALPEVLAIPWHDVEPTKERQCPGVKRWARDLSRPLLLAACRPHIPALQLPQDLTQVIIESRAGNVQPQEFRDRYEDAVVELIRAKQARIPAKVTGRPSSARMRFARAPWPSGEEEGCRPRARDGHA